ncbi:carboxypeptidase-like regulatory domain-containing protein [Pontibacter actiniarum]|uniref:carboxypeptidase-like regulatory domain-containing protein n=1 Tax=Pontibacter actiniarum TaxID=323450 RepID=UPI000416DFC4
MKKYYLVKLLLLLLFMAPFALFGQNTVRGTVTDFGSGVPLPGVNVIVVGSTTGTNTDAEGNYFIELPAGANKITFSFLGYVPETFDITPNLTKLDVRLKERTTNLQEVVVTGLATTVKRANAANAVAALNTKELVGTTNPQTLDGAISGKVVGANVVTSSGAPGGGISVKMRGITSIFGEAEPLYVIDGIIMDNSSISSG